MLEKPCISALFEGNVSNPALTLVLLAFMYVQVWCFSLLGPLPRKLRALRASRIKQLALFGVTSSYHIHCKLGKMAKVEMELNNF